MFSISEPSTLLITGIMAAGKSSVAQRLAERLPKSVHLHGDYFRKMIVSGRAEQDLELTAEAERQLLLRYRIAAAAARLYLEAGFSVVYQDIIIGPMLADVIRDHQANCAPLSCPLYVVVLCPDPLKAAARDEARAKTAYSDPAQAAAFDQYLRAHTPRLGLWVDSTCQTEGETVDFILAHLAEARVNGGGE